MKTIQIFNIIALSLLFGLLWLVNQNSTALFQYSEKELIASVKLNEHIQLVLNGKKKETVDHLLAVMKKISATLSSSAEVVRNHSSSLESTRNIIFSLIIIQIFIMIMLYMKYNSSSKSELGK